MHFRAPKDFVFTKWEKGKEPFKIPDVDLAREIKNGNKKVIK